MNLPTEPQRKVLFLDIENIANSEFFFRTYGIKQIPAGFCADKAYVLMLGYKWLGETDTHCLMRNKKSFIDNPEGDDELMQEIYEIISKADVIVTYYGSGHDMPFLNARLARAGLFLDTRVKHIDMWKVVRSKMRLSSSRMDNIAEFLGTVRKQVVSSKLWAYAWSGNYAALKEMADYCKGDVDTLEDIYIKLRPLITTHPALFIRKTKEEILCTTCGSGETVKLGFWCAQQKTYQKHMCKGCGSYFKGAEIKK